MSLIYALDLIGTLVFAISGTLVATEKNMDAFGATVIAVVTAVGGGTLRDLLIGATPVGWLQNEHYIYIIASGIFVGIFLKPFVLRIHKTMFIFDTIGIGLFTVLGMQKTLAFGLSPAVAIMMGTITAVFGGVIRDVLSNRIPLIFRKEIYATACLIGGLFYAALYHFNVEETVSILIAIVVIIIVRIISVKRSFQLPTLS